MKWSLSGLLGLMLLVTSASPAGANLSRHDGNDVWFHLDIERASSLSWPDTVGMGITFHDAIARRLHPKIRVLYDALGDRAPDFVLRFHYYRLGHEFAATCDFVRLSDRAHLNVSPADDRQRYVYCEFSRPHRMEEHTGVRWRVVAVIPGVGRDYAPNAGWYPHT